MASSYCWNCFSKLRPSPRSLLPTHLPLRGTRRAPFHSTAPQHRNSPNAGKPKSQSPAPKFRQAQASRLGIKKKIPDRPHRLTPDEVKAARKPVSVSNANALATPGVDVLSVENMADESSRGKVFSFSKPCVESLRALRVFKPTQSWPMFKEPGTFMRGESVELAKLIRDIGGHGDGEAKGKNVSQIITGAKGTGKSIHLVQAMAMARLNNWVVINVPDALEYVSATTAYAPLRDSTPVQYVQKNATADLLGSIAQANSIVLGKLHLSQQHDTVISNNLNSNSSLLELARTGASRSEIAWSFFQALWKELTAKSPTAKIGGTMSFKPRPPMLVTVDNLPHWMRNSAYFNPEYTPIHAHDLTLVNHFLSLMSPSSALPNGSIALYATTTTNCLRCPSLNITLKQLAARNAGVEATSPDFPLPPPYQQLDDRVMSLFNDTTAGVQELSGISRDETRKLLEYYALNGLMRERISENLVGEKWTLSGGGVIGELERFGKRIRTSP